MLNKIKNQNAKTHGLLCFFSASLSPFSMGLPLRVDRMRWLALKIVTFVTAFPSTAGAVPPPPSLLPPLPPPPSGEQTTRRKEREKMKKGRTRMAELQSSCALNKARLVGKYELLWCWKPTHPHLSLFSLRLCFYLFVIHNVCVCHSLFHAGILSQRCSSLDERTHTTLNQSWRAGGGGIKHGAHISAPHPSIPLSHFHSLYFSFCLTHTHLYLRCTCCTNTTLPWLSLHVLPPVCMYPQL